MLSVANDKLGLKTELLKAMSHPIRLSIIELLGNGEQCLRDITANLQVDTATISRHLSVLKQVGIVEHRREGPHMVYWVSMPCALDIARCLERAVFDRLKERPDTTVV